MAPSPLSAVSKGMLKRQGKASQSLVGSNWSSSSTGVLDLPKQQFIRLCIRAFAGQVRVNEKTRMMFEESRERQSLLEARQDELETSCYEREQRITDLADELTVAQSDLCNMSQAYEKEIERVTVLSGTVSELQEGLQTQHSVFEDHKRQLQSSIEEQRRILLDQAALLDHIRTRRVRADALIDASLLCTGYYLSSSVGLVRVPMWLLTGILLRGTPRLARLVRRVLKIAFLLYFVSKIRQVLMSTSIHSGQGNTISYAKLGIEWIRSIGTLFPGIK